MDIRFVRLNEKAREPLRATTRSAGYDLCACLREGVAVTSGEVVIVGTGIAIEIPDGMFGMVCSRSGLAAKYGLVILNSPGIIDSDYRGEIKCIVINHSKTPFIIEGGMRIAQLIILRHCSPSWTEASDITESKRGEGGIGSTGLN
jgi:dUTP pyrophosphatase